MCVQKFRVFSTELQQKIMSNNPDSKFYGANMGPIWAQLAPDGPHVGPMNLAIRESNSIWHLYKNTYLYLILLDAIVSLR